MNLISQLNTLESSGLIRLLRAQPELEYLFRHALAQDAAYSSLLKQDRKHLHLSVAESLETLYPGQTGELAATLAWHFEHAESRDKAISYLRQAGDRARAMFANQEALSFYQRAIEHIETLRQSGTAQPDQWREAEIAIREDIADLLELAGNHEAGLAGYDLVMNLLAAEQNLVRARLYRKLANIRVSLRNVEQALDLFSKAESTLDTDETNRTFEEWDEWLLIQLDRSWLLYYQRRVDEMSALLEKVLPLIENHGSSVTRSRVYYTLGSAHFSRERFIPSDETMIPIMKSFEIWRESGLSVEVGFVVFGVGFCRLWRCEFEEAERMLYYGLGLAEKTGDALMQVFYLTYLTVLYRKLGELDKVKEFAARSEDVARKSKLKVYLGTAMANYSWIAWREGRGSDAQGHALEALDHWLWNPAPYPFYWLALWPMLAIALQEKRMADVVDCARKMLLPDQQRLPDELTSVMEQAIAALDQGQTEHAQAQFEEASRIATMRGYL